VGFDPDTGGSLLEIEGAVYAGPGVEGQFVIVPNPNRESTSSRRGGFGDGAYTLSAGRLSADGLITLGTFSGTVTQGQSSRLRGRRRAAASPNPTPLEALGRDQRRQAVRTRREIKHGLARHLLEKLRNARKHLRHGRKRAAADRLKAFVRRIRHSEAGGSPRPPPTS
jgi:hypothetical protein